MSGFHGSPPPGGNYYPREYKSSNGPWRSIAADTKYSAAGEGRVWRPARSITAVLRASSTFVPTRTAAATATLSPASSRRPATALFSSARPPLSTATATAALPSSTEPVWRPEPKPAPGHAPSADEPALHAASSTTTATAAAGESAPDAGPAGPASTIPAAVCGRRKHSDRRCRHLQRRQLSCLAPRHKHHLDRAACHRMSLYCEAWCAHSSILIPTHIPPTRKKNMFKIQTSYIY